MSAPVTSGERRIAACGIVHETSVALGEFVLLSVDRGTHWRPFAPVWIVERRNIVGPRRGGVVWQPVTLVGWLCGVARA